MQNFEFASPANLAGALALLGTSFEDAQVMGGGTDLISLMKDYIVQPKRVVSLRQMPELKGIAKQGTMLRIGASTTLQELMESPLLRELPSLSEAIRGVSSPQIRNMGTVGGDLCQRPRCWYFRQGHGLLGMKDGVNLIAQGENRYHAIFTNGAAHFVSASSLGPALSALGAKVKLTSASGNREVAVSEFFRMPMSSAEREIDLKPNEILTDIMVPMSGVKNATYEVRHRDAIDWPLATASVALRMDGSTVKDARIVLGHVAPAPWNAARAAESLNGKSISVATAMAAADVAVEGAKPLSQNAYKVQLARTAVKRALLAAAGISG
jgi:xanthine dehydrogenase YagS FAD-binding subunit